MSLVFSKNDLKEKCEVFLQSEIQSSCFLLFGDSVQAFCVGLASFHVSQSVLQLNIPDGALITHRHCFFFQIYRKTRSSVWLMNARKRLQDMKLWNEQGSSWNFNHKLQLMEAEEHYSSGNLNQAKESYNNAIESARLSRFVNDEALANELAGRFYLETGDLASSLEHFQTAHSNYSDWGAVGKANHLFNYTNDTFTSYLSNRHNNQC